MMVTTESLLSRFSARGRRIRSAVLVAAMLGWAAMAAVPAAADVSANIYIVYGAPTSDPAALTANIVECLKAPATSFCYRLSNGQALGAIDGALSADESAFRAGLPFDDEQPLPAPEGPDNPVVTVCNATSLPHLIAAGASSFSADVAGGVPVYYVSAGKCARSAVGPLDAETGEQDLLSDAVPVSSGGNGGDNIDLKPYNPVDEVPASAVRDGNSSF